MKRETVADLDAQSWRRHPLVTEATAHHSTITSGAYLRILKVPITTDRYVCLDRHQLYSREKYERMFSSPPFLAALDAPATVTLEDGVFFTGAGTYWHYLVDGLGLFHTLPGAQGRNLFVDAELSDDQVGFVLAFARAAGFGEFRTVQKLAGQFYHFANGTFYCHQRIPPKIAWVRSVLGLDRAPSPGAGKRLFVLRNKAATRRLLNQDRIAQLLGDRLGFEAVDPAATTIAQQVEAFRDAEVVVGPHGAGLGNFLFSTRPRLMVEIFHSKSQVFFRGLCHTLQARHHTISGTPVAENAPNTREDNVDYVADEEMVLRTLEALIAEGSGGGVNRAT